MKKQWGILLILCLLAVALAGCNSGEPEPNGEEESRLIAVAEADPREGRPWTEVKPWNELSKYEGDLDGDGAEEVLQLLVAAEKSPDGEIAWDDGQQWLLLVTDGEEYYPLFDEYVQLGSAYFTVSEPAEAGNVNITVLVTTGAGLRLMKTTFDPAEEGYREKPVYADEAINLLHTSFQGYR